MVKSNNYYSVEKDIGGNGTAYYRYDSQGQRVRKVVVNVNVKKERLYIGDWELWQQSTSGTVETERETLNISDDQSRFLQLETLTITDGKPISPTTNWRYQYDNHLGSACLELDENAALISYEEYFPFGSTSYRSGKNVSEVKLKRYRYCGKERDEESGLYYYGARYYAAWLGRLVSIDPLKNDYPQLTPYNYAGNKPITYKDLHGLQSDGGDDKVVPIEQSLPIPENVQQAIDAAMEAGEAGSTVDITRILNEGQYSVNISIGEGENATRQFFQWGKADLGQQSFSEEQPFFSPSFSAPDLSNPDLSTPPSHPPSEVGGFQLPEAPNELKKANDIAESFGLGNQVKTELIDYAVRKNSGMDTKSFRKLSKAERAAEEVKALGKTGAKYLRFFKQLGTAGDIITTGYSLYEVINNPTVGNMTKSAVQTSILVITVFFPVLGLGLGIAEMLWGDKLYKWVDQEFGSNQYQVAK